MNRVLQEGETEVAHTRNDISGEHFHPITLQNWKTDGEYVKVYFSATIYFKMIKDSDYFEKLSKQSLVSVVSRTGIEPTELACIRM
jgi:hypothetical protein